MTEHTPGPLRIYLQDVCSPRFEGTTWCVDLINGETSDCPDVEYIRADIAKELLEALEPFAHLSKVMEEGQFLHWKGVYVSYEQAQAAQQAIAKAKGEQE